MAPWGPLQRQLLAYMARHPQFQKAVKDASQRVTTHPTFQKAKQQVYASFDKAGAKAARGTNAAGHGSAGGAAGSTTDSTFYKWKRAWADQWQKHMVRAVSFIFANIMTLLVLIQFGPMIWHFCKRGMHYLASSPSNPDVEQGEKRRKKRKDTDGAEASFRVEAPDDSMRNAILQSVPPPASNNTRATESTPSPAPVTSQWGQSSALFDDTAGSYRGADVQQTFNNMHKDVFRASSGDVQADFNTSFLVKMGDETTFTSSLEREALTGGVISRS